MSIVRTTRQARGLQRCSTRPCVICGKDARGKIAGSSVVFEKWHQLADDSAWVCAQAWERGGWFWSACPKHREFVGVSIQQRLPSQLDRVIVRAA